MKCLEEMNIPEDIATEDDDTKFMNALYLCHQAGAPSGIRSDNFEVRDMDDRIIANILVNVAVQEIGPRRGVNVQPVRIGYEYNGRDLTPVRYDLMNQDDAKKGEEMNNNTDPGSDKQDELGQESDVSTSETDYSGREHDTREEVAPTEMDAVHKAKESLEMGPRNECAPEVANMQEKKLMKQSGQKRIKKINRKNAE